MKPALNVINSITNVLFIVNYYSNYNIVMNENNGRMSSWNVENRRCWSYNCNACRHGVFTVNYAHQTSKIVKQSYT